MISVHRPHPFIYNKTSILLPGALACLLIISIAPFGFSDVPGWVRVGLGCYFGLIASLGVVIVVNLLKWLTPAFMKENHWTVGKELVLIMSVVFGISLLNFFSFLILNISDTATWTLFRLVIVYTTAISIFPVAILVLYEQLRHQRTKLLQAKTLTDQLRTHFSEIMTNLPSGPSPISFEAINGKPELRLMPEEVLFLKSDGNYVEIHYLIKEEVKKKLIRNRLKEFANVLPQKLFFHCHKSYIVNGMHITRVEGNARNLELLLRGTEIRIPVSRSKSKDLAAFLNSD